MAFDFPREGTRRLTLVLACGAVAVCLVFFGFSLGFRGIPYWKGWWVVMAGILVLAVVASRLVAWLVEWVAKGYEPPR